MRAETAIEAWLRGGGAPPVGAASWHCYEGEVGASNAQVRGLGAAGTCCFWCSKDMSAPVLTWHHLTWYHLTWLGAHALHRLWEANTCPLLC